MKTIMMVTRLPIVFQISKMKNELKLGSNPLNVNFNYCAHGKMAKVIIMMVTRHEYIVGIYFSIIPP